MKTIATHWRAFLDRQHHHPSGVVGALIGERMGRQHAPETRWTRDLLALRPTDRVLELGCGAGRGLSLAAQQIMEGHVLGVDLSATMLRSAARRNGAALRAQRLTLVRGDLHALPFATERFDKLFSIHTLYFWPEPLETLTALLGLLKPGGMLVVTLATGTVSPGGEDTYWPLHQQVEAVVQQLGALPITGAALLRGPNSRHFNNVAIVAQR